jgi:uncharacterized protein (TIGR02145 family)
MKTINRIKFHQLIIMVVPIFLTSSCECDKELSRRELITSTTWSMTYGGCEEIKDEEYLLVKFNLNGTFAAPGGFLGYTSWSFKDNDETLLLDYDEYKIIKLSETELKFRWKDEFWACALSFKPISSSKAITTGVSALTKNSAMLYGTIRTDISSPTVTFEYGTSTAYGTTISATNGITPGTISNIVTASVSGLTPGTIYHYRIRALNSSGTFSGQDLTFRTYNDQTVSDINGNVYNTVTIGSKVWMAENLKVTKFNDGKSISLITDGKVWGETSTPAYCWYDNDSLTYKNDYGALYNWFTVSTGKLCPSGWHIPSIQEWGSLTGYLYQNAGGKMKEAGTNHWFNFDKFASNESGFSALPGGWRTDNDTFFGLGEAGYWWSSSEDNPLSAWHFDVFGNSYTSTIMVKEYGCSIRCLKD